MVDRPRIKGRIEELFEWFWPLNFIKSGEALFIVNPFALEFYEQFVARLIALPRQNDTGVLQDRFDHGEDIKGVVDVVAIKKLDCIGHER